jgi:hypothetical protein
VQAGTSLAAAFAATAADGDGWVFFQNVCLHGVLECGEEIAWIGSGWNRNFLCNEAEWMLEKIPVGLGYAGVFLLTDCPSISYR